MSKEYIVLSRDKGRNIGLLDAEKHVTISHIIGQSNAQSLILIVMICPDFAPLHKELHLRIALLQSYNLLRSQGHPVVYWTFGFFDYTYLHHISTYKGL